MKKTIKKENDDWVRFFQRHLVPILFSFKKGANVHHSVVTAFVISVRDYWFLITAGHCISQIENNIEYGYQISNVRLVDSLGNKAQHSEPIPFDYKNAGATKITDEFGFDYGVMFLRPYYRALLEANNVVALNEKVWKLQPTRVDFHLLLGIPFELTKITEHNIEFTPTVHFIKELKQPPSGFTQMNLNMFYGQIELGSLDDIGGMSGGPLFAFYQNPNGELRYWLCALQSKWLPDSHYIAACSTEILGNFIEDELLKLANGNLGE